VRHVIHDLEDTWVFAFPKAEKTPLEARRRVASVVRPDYPGPVKRPGDPGVGGAGTGWSYCSAARCPKPADLVNNAGGRSVPSGDPLGSSSEARLAAR